MQRIKPNKRGYMAQEQLITVDDYVTTLRKLAAEGRWSPGKLWPVTEARMAVKAVRGAGGNGSKTGEYRDYAVKIVTAELIGEQPAAVPARVAAPLPEEVAVHLDAFMHSAGDITSLLAEHLGGYIDQQRVKIYQEATTEIDIVKAASVEQVATAIAERDAAMGMVEQHEATIEQLTTELAYSKKIEAEANGRADELKHQAKSAVNQATELERALATSKTSVKTLEGQRKWAEQQLEQERKRHDETKVDLRDATAEGERQRGQAQQLEQQAKATAVKVVDLEKALAEKRTEAATTAGKAEQMERQLATETATVADLQKALAEKSSEAAMAAGKAEELERHVAAMAKKLEDGR